MKDGRAKLFLLVYSPVLFLLLFQAISRGEHRDLSAVNHCGLTMPASVPCSSACRFVGPGRENYMGGHAAGAEAGAADGTAVSR